MTLNNLINPFRMISKIETKEARRGSPLQFFALGAESKLPCFGHGPLGEGGDGVILGTSSNPDPVTAGEGRGGQRAIMRMAPALPLPSESGQSCDIINAAFGRTQLMEKV